MINANTNNTTNTGEINDNESSSSNSNNNELNSNITVNTTQQQQQQQQQNDKQNENNSSSKRVKSVADSGEETENEDEIVEESPNGRWAKRKERVFQRDALTIDKAYLAMDTENGYEVVWNEINISSSDKESDEESFQKLEAFFTNLLKINHLNVVKFHGHWIDRLKSRIIFITEYMASGSLKQFLRNAKKTNQPIKKSTWRRWCIQLLTALHYLHNCDQPIVHRELSCDTIYIQHNGLIKIGSISPDILHTCAKIQLDNNVISKNAHFIAPELRNVNNTNTSSYNDNYKCAPEVDIYSFGIVALEMFNMDLGGNGDTHPVTDELVEQSIEALEDQKQKDFIRLCLNNDPTKRPTSKELLFHKLLYDIPTLKRLSAHYFFTYHDESQELNLENSITKIRSDNIKAHLELGGDNDNESILNARLNEDFIATSRGGTNENKYKKTKFIEDLSKYMEDVKAGLHPSTAFLSYSKEKQQPSNGPSAASNPIINNLRGNISGAQSPISSDNNEYPSEKRKAQELLIQIVSEDSKEIEEEDDEIYSVVITVSFEDKIKRSAKARLENTDTAGSLAGDLIKCGLISEIDKDRLIEVLNESLKIRDDKLEDKNKSKTTPTTSPTNIAADVATTTTTINNNNNNNKAIEC